MGSYAEKNILFFLIPKSLGCASYVAIITLARRFIKNGTLLDDENTILLKSWKGSPSTVNNTRIDNTENIRTRGSAHSILRFSI